MTYWWFGNSGHCAIRVSGVFITPFVVQMKSMGLCVTCQESRFNQFTGIDQCIREILLGDNIPAYSWIRWYHSFTVNATTSTAKSDDMSSDYLLWAYLHWKQGQFPEDPTLMSTVCSSHMWYRLPADRSGSTDKRKTLKHARKPMGHSSTIFR